MGEQTNTNSKFCKETEVRGRNNFYMGIWHEKVEKRDPYSYYILCKFCFDLLLLWNNLKNWWLIVLLCELLWLNLYCIILFMSIWFSAIVGNFENLTMIMNLMKTMNELCVNFYDPWLDMRVVTCLIMIILL